MSKAFAISIVCTLREHSHRAYLVGGCVRDLLLGREPADYDVATDATPDQVMRIFPETYAVGAQFGVVLVPIPESEREKQASKSANVSTLCDSAPGSASEEAEVRGHRHKACVEVATFRCDIGYSDGRHPDEVHFSSDPREDVQRRDFNTQAFMI